MTLASKVQTIASALRAALTMFGVSLKLEQDNKLVIVIIIN